MLVCQFESSLFRSTFHPMIYFNRSRLVNDNSRSWMAFALHGQTWMRSSLLIKMPRMLDQPVSFVLESSLHEDFNIRPPGWHMIQTQYFFIFHRCKSNLSTQSSIFTRKVNNYVYGFRNPVSGSVLMPNRITRAVNFLTQNLATIIAGKFSNVGMSVTDLVVKSAIHSRESSLWTLIDRFSKVIAIAIKSKPSWSVDREIYLEANFDLRLCIPWFDSKLWKKFGKADTILTGIWWDKEDLINISLTGLDENAAFTK